MRDFCGQPGFPYFHVNRPKIVGTAQRKVSRKTAMGLKGGRAGQELMLFPPLPFYCLFSLLSISRLSPLSEWEKWGKIWKILSNWSNLSSYAAPKTYICIRFSFFHVLRKYEWNFYVVKLLSRTSNRENKHLIGTKDHFQLSPGQGFTQFSLRSGLQIRGFWSRIGSRGWSLEYGCKCSWT